MRNVYIASDNIISPLGSTTEQNFAQLVHAKSGIMLHDDITMSAEPFHASLFTDNEFITHSITPYTKFEQLLIASIKGALNNYIFPGDPQTILIISSTKGNISLLEDEPVTDTLKQRLALHTSAKLVSEYFGFVNPPIVVSNACISGMLALIMGMRYLQAGIYKHAVVVGADVISKFVLSGFQSFQAISPEPCKPFDSARKGINLGEGASTVILSVDKKFKNGIKLAGGATSNDANHISGPSRTGEELFGAIRKAMNAASVQSDDIGFISAHGTATIYNDEMEAKAIGLASLQEVPVNSLKGYYGHTLGAAGLIETVLSAHSLKEKKILPTKGFSQLGTSVPVNVCKDLVSHNLTHCLKTASGFGGCNAAIVLNNNNY